MLINFKTEYSFLKSVNKIDEIIKYCKDNKISTAGVCDFENTYASFEFYEKCLENDIKPLIGCEIFINNQNHLVYAKDVKGFEQLNKLLRTNTFTDIECEHLIIILAKGSLVDQLINKQISFEEIQSTYHMFKTQDIYIGVYSFYNETFSYKIFEYVKKNEIKYLYIDSINYLTNEKFDAYLTMVAIDKQTSFNKIKQIKNKYYKRGPFNLEQNTSCFEEFSSKINLELNKINANLLKYDNLKSYKSSKEYLKSLAFYGLNKRNVTVKQKYTQRLEYELEVISNLGYDDYFLIVWDIVKYAKKNDILVGPGRGSAAGCLVSYCLGITEIDPIKNNLLFERFLNPMRKTMPDIDLDFEDHKREQVISYITKRFENSAKISTITRLQAKSSFRDVCRVHNFDIKKVNQISKAMNSQMSYNDNLMSNKLLANEYNKDVEFRNISDIVTQLEGLARQHSIHAAGIIISNISLDYIGVVNQDNVIYQESNRLEKIGLLKIDILALSNLSFLKRLVKRVSIKEKKQFNLRDINYNDKKTYELLSSGNTLGIFQLESQGIRNVLKKVRPNNFADLANILALYRPGPMPYIDEYVKNKNLKQINEVLKDTRGIMIYQEQIMQMSQKVANYSLAQADVLRRAISKKDKELLVKNSEEFIESGIKNGFKREYVENIFSDILSFADYGFNKSHAYSYAMISYQLAYIKVNYPDIFLSELFRQNLSTEKRDEFFEELRNLNIKILPPDIFISNVKSSSFMGNILLGLTDIKNISNILAEKIIENRKNIVDSMDFEEKIKILFNDCKLDNQQITNLVYSGSLDYLKLNHETLVYNIDIICNMNTSAINRVLHSKHEITKKDELSFEKISEKEFIALGFNLQYNVFDKKKENLQSLYNMRIYSAEEALALANKNKRSYSFFTIVFELKSLKQITTKKGDEMAFLMINSPSEYDVTVFPDVYNRVQKVLENKINEYVVAEVKIENNKLYLQKL